MEVSPESEILFSKAAGQANARQTISISNTTGSDASTTAGGGASLLAFKVKTTAPKQFVVRPNAGKLAPGERVDITIVLQGKDIDVKRKDKFLVQSMRVPAEMADLDDAAFQAKVSELWGQAEQLKKTLSDSADIVLEKKIKCVYDPSVSVASVAPAGETLSNQQPTLPDPAPKPSQKVNEAGGRKSLTTYEDTENNTPVSAIPTTPQVIAPSPVSIAPQTPTPPAAPVSQPAPPPPSNLALEKALKELRESKDKIVSLQSACEGYKQELDRVNMLRQRRADSSIPTTSTVTSSSSSSSSNKSLKQQQPNGVNFQALALLCFISFILGAWLF